MEYSVSKREWKGGIIAFPFSPIIVKIVLSIISSRSVFLLALLGDLSCILSGFVLLEDGKGSRGGLFLAVTTLGGLAFDLLQGFWTHPAQLLLEGDQSFLHFFFLHVWRGTCATIAAKRWYFLRHSSLSSCASLSRKAISLMRVGSSSWVSCSATYRSSIGVVIEMNMIFERVRHMTMRWGGLRQRQSSTIWPWVRWAGCWLPPFGLWLLRMRIWMFFSGVFMPVWWGGYFD